MRRRAKVDGNHAEIVEALRKKGWLVLSLAPVGDGCPDILAVKPFHGGGSLAIRREWSSWALIEVKTEKGKLTKDQQKFRDQGWPVTVIRSVQEALDL